MLIVPASTAACAGIAIGLSKDLLQRAAEVNLKERRTVVVVPRETPVTRSHLEHLIALHDERLFRGIQANSARFSRPCDALGAIVTPEAGRTASASLVDNRETTMKDIAQQLRAQLAWSTDPLWIERMARAAEGRPSPRPRSPAFAPQTRANEVLETSPTEAVR